MSLLKLRTIDKTLLISENAVFTSGSVSVDSIEITIDDTWNFENAEYFLCCESSGTSAEGKTALTRNGNILSCDVPIFVTASPDEWKIGIYAEQNALRIKTSTLIEITVIQGTKTDATDPYEPIKREAYEEGYKDGYEAGNVFEKQIVSWGEELGRDSEFNAFFNMGLDNAFVDLPYISPKNYKGNEAGSINTFGYSTPKIGAYIKSFGFDFSFIKYVKSFNGSSLFTNRFLLEKVTITGVTRTGGSWFGSFFSNMFIGCTELKEFSTDILGIPLNSQISGNSKTFAGMFNGCTHLKKIGAFDAELRKEVSYDETHGIIDFTGIGILSNMFSQCERLEEVRLKPNSLLASLSFKDSPKLSKASVLSIINGCVPYNTASTPTLQLNGICKDEIFSNSYCIFNDATGIWEDYDLEVKPEKEGVMPYDVVLTSSPDELVGAKGWNLQ